MDAALQFLQPFDLHPVVDHFTIALLMVGVLIDLVASLFPLRPWMRYMALTLMILGALAAGASYATGDAEADRIWKGLGDPAKAVLHRHATLAEYTAIAFGILAIWRILIESIGALAGSRPIYLIIAVIAACFLGYVGHLGGELVYTYGAGTAVMAAEATPAQTPAAIPTPPPIPPVPSMIPTVSVPTPLPTPAPSAAPSPAAAESANPSDSPKPSPTSSASPDHV
jgi:uncharacterized membrane protein